MKKLICILLLLAFFSYIAYSQMASIQAVSGALPGHTISVPVVLSGFAPNTITAFQFSIQYDTIHLQFVSASNWYPGINGVGILPNPPSGNTQSISFVWGDTPDTIPDGGMLCTINFLVKQPGNSCDSIYWSDFPTPRLFADDNYNEYNMTYHNGQICSAPCVPVYNGYPSISVSGGCNQGNYFVTANAEGTDPFAYQWQYYDGSGWGNVANGTPAGAIYTNSNSRTMEIAGLNAAPVNQYRCYITNCGGNGISISDILEIAESSTPVKAEILSQIGTTPGDTVAVPIILSGFSPDDIGSFSFTINYDTNILSFPWTVADSGASNWYPGISGVIITDLNNGQLTFEWDDTGVVIPDNSILCELNFKYKDSVTGCGNVQWGDVPVSKFFADEDDSIWGIGHPMVHYCNGYVCPACDSVAISTQPAGQDICQYGSAVFSVGTTGTSPYSYHWQYFDGNIWLNVTDGTPAGAIYTNAATGTITINGISAVGNHQYRCYVTNCSQMYSDTSVVALLGIRTTPSAPVVATVNHTSCGSFSGSIMLSGLPAGPWVINPGSITGSGADTTLTGLLPGTYLFTVSNDQGCTSPASNVTIGLQPFCPYASAGDDVLLNCGELCLDLNAICQPLNETDTYSVSSIPFNPPYPFDTGAPILVNIDDTWSNVINLPFTFCFYGQAYNQLITGSNGVVSFDLSPAGGYCPWSFSNMCPSSNLIKNAIFGVYHDIDPSVSGSMYYAILGTSPARTFVVNWDEVSMYSSSCSNLKATHQIVLYETTNIIDVYIQNKPLCSSWNNGNGLVGIQNATGTAGMAAPGRNSSAWTASNEAWRFTPAGNPTYSFSWWQDTVQVGTGQSINVCPDTTTTYVLQVDYNLCSGNNVMVSDSVTVFICDSTTVRVSPLSSSVCQGQSVTINAYWGTSYSWAPATGLNTTSGPVVIASPSATTVYTLTAISQNGNTVITSVVVNVKPLALNVSVDDYKLSADTSGDSFQWLDCNNAMQPVIGAIYSSYTSAVAGNYAVIVSSGACADTSECYEVPPNGIESFQTGGIFVYPNPVTDDLTIEYPGNVELLNLEILNSVGRVVFSGKILDKKVIQAATFPAGVYLLKLDNGHSVKLKKIIKN
mgnify:CR=1 FL=1